MNTGLPLALEVPAALLVGALGQYLGVATALAAAGWRPAEEHWAERARRAWSARVVISWGPLLMMAMLFVFGVISGAAGADDDGVSFGRNCAALCLGGFLGNVPIMRRMLGRKVTLWHLLGEYAVLFLVRAPAYVAFLVMFGLLLAVHSTGPAAWVIMGTGLAVATMLTVGAALPLARGARLFTAPSARLERIVAEASARVGIAPPPRAYLLRWQWANAVALPFNWAVAFTPAILDRLSDEELIAVCLHEIAHLQETTVQKLTRLSGLLLLFPVCASPFVAQAFGATGILAAMGVMLVGGGLLRGFSQRMEKRADAAGHAEEPRILASALEKLYEYNLVPAVMRGKRHTHPHLYDRLLAAGTTPAYPRPVAPSLFGARLGLLLQMGVVIGAFAFTPGGRDSFRAIGEWVGGVGQPHRPGWRAD